MRRSPVAKVFLLAALLLGLLLLWVAGASWRQRDPAQAALNTQEFNGQRAYRDVEYQMGLGPRMVGTPAHRAAGDWIISELRSAGWEVDVQVTQVEGQPIRNIAARWGTGRPWLVLGAHYDTRQVADRDRLARNRDQPVPGANDGASGVAVLLELARLIPQRLAGGGRFNQIWLVFFDAEDGGGIPGGSAGQSSQWILGSQAFVDSLPELPDAAVVVDMIGDADLDIYQEKNSDSELTAEIWAQAAQLGYQQYFIPTSKHAILDDHIPFRNVGVPAVDIIDFDYPYWHTTQDTADKVSASSLQVVGDTLLAWLEQQILAPGDNQ